VLKIIQLLLLPLAFIYELILRLRNHIYDIKLVAPTSFDVPTICVGNLAFGGTGKTPHIEFLIQLLQDNFKIAVLSRGYARKTQGYVFAGENSSALLIGDEPFQIFLGHPEVAVGVCESRVLGIPNLLYDAPETNLILLDDAFQHRQLQCGLNILLTDYERPYYKDFLVPSGYLREYRGAAKRADIIIVSKCKPTLTKQEAELIKKAISPKTHQTVFFSTMAYANPVPVFGSTQILDKNSQILAFSSIAKPEPFFNYLKEQFAVVKHKTYPDHHLLNDREIIDLTERFDLLEGQDKAIITTVKDSSKLLSLDLPESFKQLPIYSLSISPQILFEEELSLKKLILASIDKMRAEG
jgi:tetraacyldisaccharide 4'-kinase